MEKIIHTECDCLWSDDCFDEKCRKRWFRVRDIENINYKYIGICNQHLSLLINKEVLKNKHTWYADRKYIYRDVVSSIISNYINIGTYYSRDLNSNDLSNKTLSFNICDRPYIYRCMNLIDSIELYLKNDSYEIRDEIIKTIEYYFNSNHTYKKYKTKYKESLFLSRKLSRAYGKERDSIINQIFINILEMNVKNRQINKTEVKRKMKKL